MQSVGPARPFAWLAPYGVVACVIGWAMLVLAAGEISVAILRQVDEPWSILFFMKDHLLPCVVRGLPALLALAIWKLTRWASNPASPRGWLLRHGVLIFRLAAMLAAIELIASLLSTFQPCPDRWDWLNAPENPPGTHIMVVISIGRVYIQDGMLMIMYWLCAEVARRIASAPSSTPTDRSAVPVP